MNSKTASAEKCAGTLVFEDAAYGCYLETGGTLDKDGEACHQVTEIYRLSMFKCLHCSRHYYADFDNDKWYLDAVNCGSYKHVEGDSSYCSFVYGTILERAEYAPIRIDNELAHTREYICQAEKESSGGGGTVIMPEIPHVHSYKVSSSTAATCTADGSKTYTCADSSCNDSYTEVIPALGHSWYPAGEAGAHQKCSRCGATQGTHSYRTEVTKKTCTTDRIVTHICTCGYSWQETPVAALGHNSNSRLCNANGTDTLSCSRCGEIVNAYAPCVHTVLLDFDAITNGGAAVNSQYVTIGKAFTLPTATKDGWEFKGWSDSPLAHAGITGQTTKRTDATFYAIFSKLLTLRCKDTSGTKDKVATIYNSESSAVVDLPEIAPLEGWEPVGWTKDGKDYLKAGTSIKLTE